ncbi:beta-glucosidase [Naumannella cuiyingiana]|uniref:Beta-glucosidase n=1 Tax=Naumannella cuiyingiana TaxID=1347891 RepID=A0A7Z0D764_9ACTN|nr:glycoside hydrolase family 3 C-terminal domain-containing protein [Naumannella cuiyingiana]NYI70127.1 beta-glucosidase [Naumannella cuiyingiana]
MTEPGSTADIPASVPPAELAERIDRAVAALDLRQKVALLSGDTTWTVPAEPAAGFAGITTSDGPVGVRGTRSDDADPSANTPSPTALAATWDIALVERIGALLAAEARRKDVDVLLAPTVNLHRTPVGGRHFECFSEDPLLTGEIGTAYVRGVQGGGVSACVKHFVANDQEHDRFTVDIVVDDQTLRELYLLPFEMITGDPGRGGGGAWSVMAAYNAVNGPTATENPLLADVLKGEWGWDGAVMSDWFAARDTVGAGRAALDLAMPGPNTPWSGDQLVAAVEAGEVPEAAIDAKVRAILRLGARVGALADLPAPARPDDFDDADARELLRTASSAGMVLVRNDGVLPLPRGASVALVGPNAERIRNLGGGSATVYPESVSHPPEALTEAGFEVRTAPGVTATTRLTRAEAEWCELPDGSGPGVLARIYDTAGNEVDTATSRSGRFLWSRESPAAIPAAEIGRIRLQTRLSVPRAGRYRIGTSGDGHTTLTVDGTPVLDGEAHLPAGADPVLLTMAPPQVDAETELPDGPAEVVVDFVPARSETAFGGDDRVIISWLNCAPVLADDDTEIARAAELAADSDVAVVIVGTTEEVESEGFDRTSLDLPGRQAELVDAVLAANPRTVVVVNSGAPVLMPWLDRVPATLLGWFGGQEMGHALADVLSGAVEPGGRAPTTWGAPGTVIIPDNIGTDGKLAYTEGLDIGYRAYLRDGVEPAVPFGHGLGYTTWQFGEATLGDGEVSVQITNTGEREGSQVVQAYLSRSDSQVRRATAWLVGFARVEAGPGQTVTATIPLTDRAFRHWAGDGWAVEPGDYELRLGTSVADTPVALTITR